MAYVNFWKGPAADYVAETHGEGIYQCTDTGDTYIFGVKNSGSAGGGTSENEIYVVDYTNTGLDGHIDYNAVKEAIDSNKVIYIKISYSGFISLIPALGYINPSGNSEAVIVYHTVERGIVLGDGKTLNLSLRTLIVDQDSTFNVGDLTSISLMVGADGTKFLGDDGNYHAIDLSGYLTIIDAQDNYQPKGDYQPAGNYADASDIPTLPSKMVESLNNSVSGTSYTINVAYRDNKNRPGTDPFVLQFATTTTPGIMSASDKSKLDSLKGTNSNQSYQTGVANIPLATYGIQLRQTGVNGTMSFSGSLSDGQELHVIIKNVSSSAITITFPSSSSYISMSGDSMEIPGNGYLEVNVLRAGSYYYLRAAASLE